MELSNEEWENYKYHFILAENLDVCVDLKESGIKYPVHEVFKDLLFHNRFKDGIYNVPDIIIFCRKYHIKLDYNRLDTLMFKHSDGNRVGNNI